MLQQLTGIRDSGSGHRGPLALSGLSAIARSAKVEARRGGSESNGPVPPRFVVRLARERPTPILGDQVAAVFPEGANLGNRLDLAPPLLEVVHRRPGPEAGLPRKHPGPDDDDAPLRVDGSFESNNVLNAAK